MTEGWCDDEYFILFSDDEVDSASSRYDIGTAFPGHQIIGLVGWDDFILRNEAGSTFRVPTVPLSPAFAAPYVVSALREPLIGDSRFTGKLKWYVKPLAFDGEPADSANIAWVTPEDHSKLVNWWNTLWRDVHAAPGAEQGIGAGRGR